MLSVIQDIFPTFKVDKHIIHFLEGYNRRKDGMPQEFPKYKMQNNGTMIIGKKGDYDLGISFVSSFPRVEDMNEPLYKKSLTIWT